MGGVDTRQYDLLLQHQIEDIIMGKASRLQTFGISTHYQSLLIIHRLAQDPSQRRITTSHIILTSYSEKLGSSEWRKIYLNTYKSYFYNTKTKQIQWEIPEEVKDIVQELKEKRQEEKLRQKEDIDKVEKRKHEAYDSDEDEEDAKKQKVEER